MNKYPIVIIAAKEDLAFYNALSEMNERVEAYASWEPMELYLHHEYDLLILDCGLEIDTGIEFVRTMKQSLSEVPIIFIAPASSEESVRKAFKAGVRECFRKPFSIYDLKETVADLLKLKRSTSEKRTSLASNIDPITEGVSRPVTVDLPARLQQVVRYIESNYIDKIYLDKLAKDACLSKYHFCRLFKQHVGMTTMEFVTFTRVERAKQLLAKADLNLTEVALRAGFNDSSDFDRKFKKLTAFTPTLYKRILKNK